MVGAEDQTRQIFNISTMYAPTFISESNRADLESSFRGQHGFVHQDVTFLIATGMERERKAS